MTGNGLPAASALAPFHHKAFLVLWAATVVSNVGTWMYGAAAGWLMTSLDPDPLTVSLVQAATMLPMVLLALPAGALADILDRRRMLIATQIVTAALSAGLGVLVLIDTVTPSILLVFTFLGGVTAAVVAPTWQAIVPALVPREELHSALTLNSVGMNISRAIGPALGGVVIAGLGVAYPFFINAISYLCVIAALIWWRTPAVLTRPLPAEHFRNAMRTGLRHARENPELRATLGRGLGIFPFGSAYWALLPLIARDQVAGGPELYGLLLGAVGVGAVAAAFFLPALNHRLGADRLVAAGAAGTAMTLVLFALARTPALALAASILGGLTWMAVLASLNVSAQLALPDWVRARGLAVFVAVFAGAMAFGSIFWGQVAAMAGLPLALMLAAAGALLAIPFTWRWKLQAGADLDLTPSMHWPAPLAAVDLDDDRGPVLITIEYRIDPADTRDFVAAMEKLASERRRDGGYAWGLFEDAAEPGRWLEHFLADSWIEHLRQHERVSKAAAEVQSRANAFHRGSEPTVVTHWLAAPADAAEDRPRRNHEARAGQKAPIADQGQHD